MEPGLFLLGTVLFVFGAVLLCGIALGREIELARERRKHRLLEGEIARSRSRARPRPSWQDDTWIRRRDVRVEDHPAIAVEILEEAEYDWRRAHG